MTNTITPIQVAPLQPIADDEIIDLRQVVAALIRQKKLIAGVVGVTVLVSGVYAFTRDPIWQGESQIVLENQNSKSGGRPRDEHVSSGY